MKLAATVAALIHFFSVALAVGPTITAVRGGAEPGLREDHCLLCLHFSDEYLKDIADVISGSGVIGSCAELCHLFEKEVHSKLAEAVCDVLCDAVGIAGFIELIERAELDPFYLCELLKQCPIKDDGDAHIISFKIVPSNVKQNSTFKVEMLFNSAHGTGIGQLDLSITTSGREVVKDDEIVGPLGASEYMATWTKHADNWVPGNYSAYVEYCYGLCGSRLPHSKVYDTARTNFTVSA